MTRDAIEPRPAVGLALLAADADRLMKMTYYARNHILNSAPIHYFNVFGLAVFILAKIYKFGAA